MKKITFLDYPLQDGYIANWLVNGPQVIGVDEMAVDKLNYEKKSEAVKSRDDQQLPVNQRPVEREMMRLGAEEKQWQYFRCREDRKVHFSYQVPTLSLFQFWAYCGLKLPESVTVQINIRTRNPVKLWLNGSLVFDQLNFSEEDQLHTVDVNLVETNDLIIRLDHVAAGECAANFSVLLAGDQLQAMTDTNLVQLPTPAFYPHRYKIFEEMFEHVYLDEIVNHWGPTIQMRWAEGYENENYFRYQVQDETGGFVVDGNYQVDIEKPQVVGHPYRLYEKPYWVTLTPTIREYGTQWIRYTKRLPIHVLDTAYSTDLYGSPASRREEALKDASKHENDIFSAIARLELGDDLLEDTVKNAIHQVNNRHIGSEKTLCGLILLVYRFFNTSGNDGGEPLPHRSLIEQIQSSAINYRYWVEEKGNDSLDFNRESAQILFHACEILTGQLYPDHTFNASEQTGKWHKKRGEKLAKQWIQQRVSQGFDDWNSNSDWHDIFMALAQILSLAEDESLYELSAILLDKMVFLLAVNSYQGVFGSSHGRTSAGMLKSAQLEATSGITRLLWGNGVFNHHISGTVGLACSDYEFPTFFKDIAVSREAEILNLEKQVNPEGREVNLVTYKTPDFMLSSAQDFQPGQPGNHEHTWQATFGPDAIVYSTHPANSNEDPGNQPGYWLGNRRLPRIYQLKDLLIAIYLLDENDLLGYTHAYFPTPAFDNYKISPNWNFMHKGDGYLGICAANGTEFIRQGPDAYRELRSYGRANTWICQLGRQEIDGSFEEFQDKVLTTQLEWQEKGVNLQSLRGDSISLDWEGPVLLNGEAFTPPRNYHIINPYTSVEFPATSMEIQYQDYLLRLRFT